MSPQWDREWQTALVTGCSGALQRDLAPTPTTSRGDTRTRAPILGIGVNLGRHAHFGTRLPRCCPLILTSLPRQRELAATLQLGRVLPGALCRDSHARGIRANVHCALHLDSALALVNLPTTQADALAAEKNWGPCPPSSPTTAIVQLEVGGLATPATNHWGLPSLAPSHETNKR